MSATTETVTIGSGNSGDHRIEWSDGTARFICSSPPGSACRCWCKTCEESCPLSDEDGTTHVWERNASCRVVDTLDAYGAFDTYLGDGPLPEVDGPIQTEWDGDTYLWEPKATEATS